MPEVVRRQNFADMRRQWKVICRIHPIKRGAVVFNKRRCHKFPPKFPPMTRRDDAISTQQPSAIAPCLIAKDPAIIGGPSPHLNDQNIRG
jgi:hypothetical protein